MRIIVCVLLIVLLKALIVLFLKVRSLENQIANLKFDLIILEKEFEKHDHH